MRLTLALLAFLSVFATGCGSSSKTVSVNVTAPVDGSRVKADHVTVRGTVTPSNATVQVLGHDAQVGNGIFTTFVSLHRGSNSVDVVASAPGSAPASTSVTIVRSGPRKPTRSVGVPTTTVVKVPPTTSNPSTSSAGSRGDWPGGSGFTVILASKGSEAEARSLQSQATAAGLDAGVLYSSNFRSLRPGYWVVFSGTFSTATDAGRRAARAKELGYTDAYPRFVSQ